MVAKRRVKCNNCGHEFDSKQPENELRCGKCDKMDVSVLDPELGEKQSIKGVGASFKGKKGALRTIITPKTIKLEPESVAIINKLIQKNVFNDMDEATNKALDTMAALTENPRFIDYLIKGGNVKMQEEEPNPEKEIKKIQSQEVIDTHIAKKKAEAEVLLKKVKTGEASTSDFTSILKEHLAMKQMQKMIKEMDSDEEDSASPLKDMKDMMMMQVYANMIGNGNNKGNGESLQLQKKIEDLQKQIDKQDTLNEIKKLAESTKGKSMNIEDYLKIFADKMEAVEKEKLETAKAHQETQNEKDKRIEEQRQIQAQQTEGKIAELEKELKDAKTGGSGIEEITKIKNNIQILKDISKEFGEQPKEKTTAEVASELVLGGMDKLKDPLSHLAKGFADKQATERMKSSPQPTGPVVYTNPTVAPSTPPPGPIPESQESIPPPESQGNIPLEPEEDIVNTFAAQNTFKKSN